MDLRENVHSAISHINSALSEIESFPRSGLNSKALAELDLAYNSLNESISHCKAIFGPTTITK